MTAHPFALLHRIREKENTSAPALVSLLEETFAGMSDFAKRPIGTIGSQPVFLCYLTSLVSSQRLSFAVEWEELTELSTRVDRYTGPPFAEGSRELCVDAICGGAAILCLEGTSAGLILDISDTQHRNVASPVTENVLQGPLYAFNEDLQTNFALIRQRIRSAKLKIWETKIGTASRTRTAICYYEGAVDIECLANVQAMLKNIVVDGLQDTGQLLRLLVAKKKMRLFPLAVSSERPDRAVAELLKGKLILLVDGSPFALILPAVYTDFWHSPEDLYVNVYVSYFLNALRFLAMFINLFLPAFYVALTSVNIDVNRLEISLAAAASREGVPYPVFIETFLMLIVIDFITEAGIRLPKTISSTVTMVGGVVLGQAIIQANIVSNLLVIIVAATAITNFIVIDYQMGLVQRVLKYFIAAGATIAGLLGIVFCFTCLVFYLSCLESFGTPYLTSLMRKKGTPSP